MLYNLMFSCISILSNKTGSKKKHTDKYTLKPEIKFPTFIGLWRK